MGFFTALGLIFITLKLMGFITWSWWLVLLPLYADILILLTIVIGAIVSLV
jgi:hypothetical protein